MDAKQANELLDAAAKNLARARANVRGPRNDQGIQDAIAAIGEVRQVVASHEGRIADLEAVLGDLGAKP